MITGETYENAVRAAREGAKLGVDCGKMCKTCAFRAGQELTPDLLRAAEDAMNMLAWEGDFRCHNEDMDEPSEHTCAGFQYARLHVNS